MDDNTGSQYLITYLILLNYVYVYLGPRSIMACTHFLYFKDFVVIFKKFFMILFGVSSWSILFHYGLRILNKHILPQPGICIWFLWLTSTKVNINILEKDLFMIHKLLRVKFSAWKSILELKQISILKPLSKDSS